MRLKTNYMFNIDKSNNKREIELLRLDKISKNKFFTKLRELNITTYQEYLRSVYWKNIKEKMYSSKVVKECFCCHDVNNLDIHHRKYKVRDIDTVNIANLVYLCRKCHIEVHKQQKQNKALTINQATKRLRKYYNKK